MKKWLRKSFECKLFVERLKKKESNIMNDNVSKLKKII